MSLKKNDKKTLKNSNLASMEINFAQRQINSPENCFVLRD